MLCRSVSPCLCIIKASDRNCESYCAPVGLNINILCGAFNPLNSVCDGFTAGIRTASCGILLVLVNLRSVKDLVVDVNRLVFDLIFDIRAHIRGEHVSCVFFVSQLIEMNLVLSGLQVGVIDYSVLVIIGPCLG